MFSGTYILIYGGRASTMQGIGVRRWQPPYLCRGLCRVSVEDGRPLGERVGMVGGRPGLGRPAGVPAEEPRGEAAAGWWGGEVGESRPATLRGDWV